jgi:predicted component of type VI protein secretion system
MTSPYFKGKEFMLNQRRLSVGAAPSSDVPLFDYRRVMERHALLIASGQDLALVPEDSQNEVKHNDRKVPENGVGPLKYGDVIQIGNAKLLYLP